MKKIAFSVIVALLVVGMLGCSGGSSTESASDGSYRLVIEDGASRENRIQKVIRFAEGTRGKRFVYSIQGLRSGRGGIFNSPVDETNLLTITAQLESADSNKVTLTTSADQSLGSSRVAQVTGTLPEGQDIASAVTFPNVDDVVRQAIEAGATVERPLADQFYGDRSATLVDPFGHKWTIATHIEDVTPEEMVRRMRNM